MAAGAVSGLGWLDFLFPPLARISDFVEYDPGNAIKFTIYRLRPSGSAGDGDTLGSFTPISMVAEGPLLLAVSSSAPYKTPAELLAAARAKPGVITYGSAGVGSVAQMATEMMNDAAKVNMLHVPYKGASNALIDLAAGQIDVMVTTYSTVVSQIKSGKVRPLGVTSLQGNPTFPDLPPVSASAPGFAIDIRVGVFAPSGTLAALVQRLNREINEIATLPEVRTLLDPDGALPSAMSPSAFATRVRDDLALWKRIATEKRIVAEQSLARPLLPNPIPATMSRPWTPCCVMPLSTPAMPITPVLRAAHYSSPKVG